MLNCREFLSRVTDFSCGDLAVPQMRETKRHLVRCASCASYWTSYRATVALARQAYGESDQARIPEDLVSEILAAARTAPRSFSPVWQVVHLLSGVAAAPLLAFYLR